MKSRDVLPDSKQILQLILTYEFKLSDSTNVTIRFPSLNNYIYDAAHEGLFIISKLECYFDFYFYFCFVYI